VKLPTTLTRRRAVAACASLVAVVAAAGCGGEITVDKSQADLRAGATLFNERCSGCHTLESANAYGSAPKNGLKYSERTNGPNFDTRQEDKESALFAIRNGGYSGAIMPGNIVVGRDAELVADFLEACSGKSPRQRDLCE
jgi:mono/diheme cytochrome c family protein